MWRILMILGTAGALAAIAHPAGAQTLGSGRADQRLRARPISIQSENSPGPFEGFLAVAVVVDTLKYTVPVQDMPTDPAVDTTTLRLRPCVEVRVADAVGMCLGYSLATEGSAHWVVDLTLISLGFHGYHLSLAAHLVEGADDGAVSLRLAIPLYAGWMPLKLAGTRLRLVWTPERIGAGFEWGWL